MKKNITIRFDIRAKPARGEIVTLTYHLNYSTVNDGQHGAILPHEYKIMAGHTVILKYKKLKLNQ